MSTLTGRAGEKEEEEDEEEERKKLHRYMQTLAGEGGVGGGLLYVGAPAFPVAACMCQA